MESGLQAGSSRPDLKPVSESTLSEITRRAGEISGKAYRNEERLASIVTRLCHEPSTGQSGEDAVDPTGLARLGGHLTDMECCQNRTSSLLERLEELVGL